MEYTLKQLIDSLATRHMQDRWGIGTALQYVKSIGACFEASGLNPAKAFSLADADLWSKELRESAERLTYCDPAMADVDQVTKSFRDDGDISNGAIAEFDCVVTSRRKDRDGDILESNGMRVDKNAPLLWQHIQLQPIGKHIQVLDQNEDRIVSKLAIADTSLGRDAATLAKFGALRISQGFRPTKFEPLEIVKNAQGQDVVKGWHIKEGDIMEVSLVSIPANTDAVITAFSQGKLHTPIVKSWAKQFFDDRPVQVPVNIELKLNGQALHFPETVSIPAPENEVKRETVAATKSQNDGLSAPPPDPAATEQPPGQKDAEPVEQKAANEGADAASVAPAAEPTSLTKMLWGAMDDELTGSFEWIQSKLSRAADSYLQLNGKDTSEGYVRLIATYADQAILCYRPWGEKSPTCYRVGWEMGEEGQPKFMGEPVDVEITAEVREKFIDVPHRKSHPSIADIRTQLCRMAASLDSEKAIAELQPVVDLLGFYSEQKHAAEWGEFVGMLTK